MLLFPILFCVFFSLKYIIVFKLGKFNNLWKNETFFYFNFLMLGFPINDFICEIALSFSFISRSF